MHSKRAAVHAGKYFLLTTLFGVLGLGLVAGGIAVGVLNATTTTVASVTVPAPTRASAGGFVLLLVGVAVWRFGKAWALYKTLPAAVEEQVADTFDTEHVKSDLASVVDSRLSDVQQDIQSMNREVRQLKQDDGNDPF
ncbi:hypothetical protein [Halospeciosus flavus]|uniref:Uncharacterized protein n=1 Tax=Halospeciosus flavus TaxID=3032283 RepID=A0ABD5Z537_9EURY|nr:hypothetical protein [Halospeciosus flavus]